MIGKTILHYKILSKLGEGGMGVVYKAKDTKLDREVALKFLPKSQLGTEDDQKRFELEAKAAAKLSHANIATVFEINEHDGQAFIAMEYIDGETLYDMIEKRPLKIKDAIKIASQIAEGLHSAHEQGIVHRDIKSANIMITAKGVVKIMDFGLAKLSKASMVTKAGTTLGTISYMSPEQTQGEKVDHRSDIWSLGVVLYEMVSGQMPFKGDYESAIIYSIMNEDPEPLTAVRTGVPMDLEKIVHKLLAKEPSRRYQNIIELPVDLSNVAMQETKISKIGSSAISDTLSQEKELNVKLKYSYKTVFTIATTAVVTIILLLIVVNTLQNRPDPEPVFVNFILDDKSEFGSPSWNHTGEKIYYVRIEDEWDTVVESFELSTGIRQEYPLTRGASHISASPVDDSFIFVREGEAFLVRSETAKPFVVADQVGWNAIAWISGEELVYTLSGHDTILKVNLASGHADTLLLKSNYDINSGCCELYFIGGQRLPGSRSKNQKILRYGMFRQVGPPLLIELDIEAGAEEIVGEGFPLALSPSGHLIVFDMNTLMSAYSIDSQGKISGNHRSLGYGIGLDVSPTGHAIFRPVPEGPITFGGEPIHMITADGFRLPLGTIPGMPGISDFTVSPDGDFIVMAGEYLDQGQKLGVFDVKNKSSNVLNVGFPPRAASFSADGWIYFNDVEEPRSIYKARFTGDGVDEVLLVLSDSLSLHGPSASPLGLVAFYRETEADVLRVFVLDQKTNSVRQISNQTGSQFRPSIHPRESLIAYVQRFQQTSIIVENLQTADRHTIASGSVDRPSFSHDGKFLYFISDGIVVRQTVRHVDDQFILGELEKVAFEPFESHIHYAPGLGDILAYTAAPPNSRDSALPYRLILNYHVYLNQILNN